MFDVLLTRFVEAVFEEIVGDLAEHPKRAGLRDKLRGIDQHSRQQYHVGCDPVGESAGGVVHVVVAGDTLFTIAQQYGVTMQDIIDANSLTNPDALSIGQELTIP